MCPPSVVEILVCVAWLEKRVTPRKTPSIGSYAIKHAVERWSGRYIPNGAAIIGVYLAGFPQYCEGYACPLNTDVGISLPSYRRLPEASELSVEFLLAERS
ncbi:hypothetical protein [Rubripirellula reticaptiva]|nr:hypothetical protein [Rubripirellula reticaptiva]